MTAFKMIAGLIGLAALAACGADSGGGAGSVEAAAPAPAAEVSEPAQPLSFAASLTGSGALTATPSAATAEARGTLDTAGGTLDLTLTVKGISIDQLADSLVAAPIGPVHFHMYARADHADPNAVSLAVPVPFGPSYAATPDGFTVIVENFPFADAGALTGSDTTLDAFSDSLRQGLIQLNIHTDAFPDGEIGSIVEVTG